MKELLKLVTVLPIQGTVVHLLASSGVERMGAQSDYAVLWNSVMR